VNSSKSLLRFAIMIAICIASMLVVVSADSGYITGNGVNFRKGPGTNFGIITVLPKGTIVIANGSENGWVKVSYNGNNGFVSGNYITVKADSVSRSGTSIDREASSKGQQVVEFAKKFLGTRYVYGGSTPSGFDCSGFTSYVYKQFGYTINRTAAGQASNGVAVSKADLQAGDIVLFKNGGSGIGHAGIYIGNGQFIHAVKPGKPLGYSTLNSGYYSTNYVCARRILK